MTDLRRKGNFNEKKSACYAAAVITNDMITATGVNELFNLPERALVTNAYLVVEQPSQAGVTVDVRVGTTVVIDDGSVATAGVIQSPIADASTNVGETINLLTGTGTTVDINFSAAPTAGRFAVVIEFVEYTLGTGDLLALEHTAA